jgi:hypothetical protein
MRFFACLLLAGNTVETSPLKNDLTTCEPLSFYYV